MRKAMVVLAILASGCAMGPESGPLVYKLGAIQSQRSADYDACKISSFKEIPQSIATDVQGGYSSPGTMQCNTIGTATQCYNVGGISAPPTAVSYDVNFELRQRFIRRCLGGKGYQYIQRPACKSDEDRRQALAQLESGLPPVDQIKCSAGIPLERAQ